MRTLLGPSGAGQGLLASLQELCAYPSPKMERLEQELLAHFGGELGGCVCVCARPCVHMGQSATPLCLWLGHIQNMSWVMHG